MGSNCFPSHATGPTWKESPSLGGGVGGASRRGAAIKGTIIGTWSDDRSGENVFSLQRKSMGHCNGVPHLAGHSELQSCSGDSQGQEDWSASARQHTCSQTGAGHASHACAVPKHSNRARTIHERSICIAVKLPRDAELSMGHHACGFGGKRSLTFERTSGKESLPSVAPSLASICSMNARNSDS